MPRHPSPPSNAGPAALEDIAAAIRACRICKDTPTGKPLPHEPKPVLRVSATARLAIAGQAPGTRVHKSGIPFTDPSGDRLRSWMGVTEAEFYDTARTAIIPMGFCFPGLDDKGGDLPPRRECAPLWRDRLMAQMPQLELVLLVGQYAHRWHLAREHAAGGVTATVRRHEAIIAAPRRPQFLPLPHPSWRNNAWIKANPWFEEEVLPALRKRVRDVMD
jgi:uracil-DNA glycosylase